MDSSELQLKAKLLTAIEKWVDENCEGKNWPNYYISDEETVLMTDAAFAVFLSSKRGQQYAKENV